MNKENRSKLEKELNQKEDQKERAMPRKGNQGAKERVTLGGPKIKEKDTAETIKAGNPTRIGNDRID